MVIYLTLIYSDLSFKLIDSNGSMMAHLRCDSYNSKSSSENFFHQLPGLELLKHLPENYVGCEMKLTKYLLKMSLSDIWSWCERCSKDLKHFKSAAWQELSGRLTECDGGGGGAVFFFFQAETGLSLSCRDCDLVAPNFNQLIRNWISN